SINVRIVHQRLCRNDILAHAYALCRSNKGASGVDGCWSWINCAIFNSEYADRALGRWIGLEMGWNVYFLLKAVHPKFLRMFGNCNGLPDFHPSSKAAVSHLREIVRRYRQ